MIPCCTSGAAVLGDSLIWCKWKMLLIKNKRKPRKPPPTAEKPLLCPETRWDPDPHCSDFMTPADGRWLRTMVSSMVASNSKHLIKNKQNLKLSFSVALATFWMHASHGWLVVTTLPSKAPSPSTPPLLRTHCSGHCLYADLYKQFRKSGPASGYPRNLLVLKCWINLLERKNVRAKQNFAVTEIHPSFQERNSELDFSILFHSVVSTLLREGKHLGTLLNLPFPYSAAYPQ